MGLPPASLSQIASFVGSPWLDRWGCREHCNLQQTCAEARDICTSTARAAKANWEKRQGHSLAQKHAATEEFRRTLQGLGCKLLENLPKPRLDLLHCVGLLLQHVDRP